MTIVLGNKKIQDVGTWQEVFKPTYSERVKKANARASHQPEVCLERARAEIKAYEQYRNEPRIIQRARFLETYLRDKTVFILEDELIVGNLSSKVKGVPISGFTGRYFEYHRATDDPSKIICKANVDLLKGTGIVSPEERKELEEVIIPYFKGKTFIDYNLERFDDELKEKGSRWFSSCPHLPNGELFSIRRDPGHQMPNHEKVLVKGLKGMREEVEWYMAQLDQKYSHTGLEEKRNFYQAVLITLDAAMAYAKRYADLAREMAVKETDPRRKKELQRIAEVCDRVPAYPARDWWEAVQSVWMIHIIVGCELSGWTNCFGRFDQYMYPYYKKSVIEDKTMTPDEALELVELFQISTFCAGEGTLALNIGGQTREGKDACNEVTMLCLEASEQLSITQPETAMKVWAGTPDKYLRKAVEVVRLGRGQPKFTGDREGIRMMSTAYPDLTIEDWREYVMLGCSGAQLPHNTNANLAEGNISIAKFVELVLTNGKCALCGRQIGPLTGDPRTFRSIEDVRKAFREQLTYFMTYYVKTVKVCKESQGKLLQAPFCSSLAEGPLQKGVDVINGGTWYTTYAKYLVGLADTADSLGVIDKLIFRDKKITWDQLIEATKVNWKGYENLRQLCINSVPKYGNDDDFADEWAVWVMHTWQDTIDWINTQKELLPKFGGMWVGKSAIGNQNVLEGPLVGGLPNGHINPRPLADAVSPGQGMDHNGPTAVIKSVSKLPKYRVAGGGPINLRISPQLLATDRDLDNFVSFIRTVEEMGIYQIQFNVISSDILRKAMKEPENYRDLMVRVGSFVAYFVNLAEEQQWDIINRTEHQGL